MKNLNEFITEANKHMGILYLEKEDITEDIIKGAQAINGVMKDPMIIVWPKKNTPETSITIFKMKDNEWQGVGTDKTWNDETLFKALHDDFEYCKLFMNDENLRKIVGKEKVRELYKIANNKVNSQNLRDKLDI